MPLHPFNTSSVLRAASVLESSNESSTSAFPDNMLSEAPGRQNTRIVEVGGNNTHGKFADFLASLVTPLGTRRTRRKINRVLSILVLVSMLLSMFGGSFRPTYAVAQADPGSANAEVAEPVHAAPYTDPHLPSLAMTVDVSPKVVSAGDTLTVTVTLQNQATDPATNLSISLPLPAGAYHPQQNKAQAIEPIGAGINLGNQSSSGIDVAVSATMPATVPATTQPSSTADPTDSATGVVSNTPSSSPTSPITTSPTGIPDPNGWTWTVPNLDGGATVTQTAVMQVTADAPNGAILASVQATAAELNMPVGRTAGAVVMQPGRSPRSTQFTPGRPASLSSYDNKVHVDVPGDLFNAPLTISHGFDPEPGKVAPPDVAGFKPGLGTFYLDALDTQGNHVHQFSQPLTITVSYTPQQLQALGISESDLALYYFDDSDGVNNWVPVDTHIDDVAHTVTVSVDHFTPFQLSDGSSPSDAYVPSLQGFQVSLYTGSVSYSYPIDVPAGAGGIKPGVSIDYNSSSTDGASGLRALQQAGWAGKGWSLDTGYVAMNKIGNGPDDSRYYTLVFNGESHDIMRGACRTGKTCGSSSSYLNDPSIWEWVTTDGSFIKVHAEPVGTLYGRGGTYGANSTPYQRYKWVVWATDGTRYEFQDDAWQGWFPSGTTGSYMEAYKWYLTMVEDTHGNRINYSYNRSTAGCYIASGNVSGIADQDVWPTTITWGGNATQADRYKVEFSSTIRTLDTTADAATNMCGAAPAQTRQLNVIKVWSMQTSTWELVRQYNLGFETRTEPNPTTHQDYYLRSDYSDALYNPDYTSTKMTLRSIQRIGEDGSTALPATTFDYGMDRGTAHYPNGSWNRLTSVNNGQGGLISFAYDDIGQVLNDGNYKNNRRVSSKTVHSGYGQAWDTSYTWSYTYSTPAYNERGSALDSGPYLYPNSATLWYNTYGAGTVANPLHKKYTEFRGHSYVMETDPNQIATEHWFYQGDVGCLPATSGDLWSNACFLNLRDAEFKKGKEYKTVVHAGNTSGTAKLQETDHTFYITNNYYGLDSYADAVKVGLWRAFVYESQTDDVAWDSNSSTSLTHTTQYTYETSYGNLLTRNEGTTSGGTFTQLRHTDYQYIFRDDTGSSVYIVNKAWAESIKDSASKWLARTVYGYDGYNPNVALGTTGDLRLIRKFYNIPLISGSTSLPDPAYGVDTSLAYDSYGNQTTSTAYAGYNTTTGMNGGSPNWGTLGGGSAARVTTTAYDTTYHALPTQYTLPSVGGAASMVQTAGYDYRMGTLTSVTDANSNVTSAVYDAFGRMITLVKPGDTTSVPTLQAVYSDNEIPFKYTTKQLEVQGDISKLRYTRSFYDGMGRKIQTKAESNTVGSFENIVQDMVYDGLGNVTEQSQARKVTEADPAYKAYLVPGSLTCTDATERWTCTQYDGLSRTTHVTTPDTKSTAVTYSLSGNYRAAVSVDAKNHKTEQRTDLFGRLGQVVEYSGNNGTEGSWATYATTTDTYNPLDLLTQVQDGLGKNITMQYDSLGRKTSMTDLTMGSWSYTYNPDGTLYQQTDPKPQTISFYYDELSRLTQKSYSAGSYSSYTYDGAGVANGKGQRTSMATYNSTSVLQSKTDWTYTTREQQASATYTIAGLSSTRTISSTYDSAGRNTSITYPNSETVSYHYDEAWNPDQASTSLGGYYVSSASYDALAQPTNISFGNGVAQTYQYTNPMSRLSNTTVTKGSNLLDKSYQYDDVGNVSQITNNISSEVQGFTYDHRDRLGSWTIGASTENYTYDVVGNLATRAGLSYTYDYTRGSGNQGGPYALRSYNGLSFTYDADGNMTADGVHTYTWTAENLPSSVTSGGVTESYSYDADDSRIKKVRGLTTTYYFGNLYEEEVAGLGSTTDRYYYTFGGKIVAQREYVTGTGTNTLKYMHGDQLGSVSLVTSSTGTNAGTQEFDPWGKVRSGGTIGTQTKLNYTGQQLDTTGLLNYNARLYDPTVGRFVSPDSIVPGASSGAGGAGGSVGAVMGSSLTVDFHEYTLGSAELDNKLAPTNPQALNRYAYVLDNPIRYVDPTGHGIDDPGTAGPPVPRPPIPEGQGTQNDWGKKVWGDNAEGARAAKEKVDNMSDEEFEKWANERGLTEKTAGDWEDFYDQTVRNGRGGAAAPERRDLLHLIKERLKTIGMERESKAHQDQNAKYMQEHAAAYAAATAGAVATAGLLLAGAYLSAPGGCAMASCAKLR